MAYGGIQFHVSGWSGSITITEGSDSFSVTPKATASPWVTASALVVGATSNCSSTYTFSVSNTGVLTISSTGTFDLTMSTAIQGIMNFSATSFSGVSSASTTTAPDGSFFPYDDGDGVLFTRRVRAPINQGFEVYDGGRWLNTPGTNHKFPVLSVSCLRSKVEEFMDAVQLVGTPSKVDLIDSGSVVSLNLGNIRINEQDRVSGWTRIGLEVVE